MSVVFFSKLRKKKIGGGGRGGGGGALVKPAPREQSHVNLTTVESKLLIDYIQCGVSPGPQHTPQSNKTVQRQPLPRSHPPIVHRVPIGRKELCHTAWALGRLGVGGVYFGGARAGDVGALEEDGVVPEGGGGDDDGSEMSRLMDKLLGECSKWLELFTPQVPVDAPEGHAKDARSHTSGGVYPLDPAPLISPLSFSVSPASSFDFCFLLSKNNAC